MANGNNSKDELEQVPNPDLLLSRVLLNEAAIKAVQTLVEETRRGDNRLLEQRSDSLAQELERARLGILALTNEQREADRREYISLISALEERRIAATNTLDQKVRDWRASDREAQSLYSTEIERRLQVLNGEHARTAHVLNNSVPREVFQSEKEALQSAITALDRTLLGMTPVSVSDKAHADMIARTEQGITAAARVLDTKIEVAQQQITELKQYVDKTTGGKTAQGALLAYAVTFITMMISVIVLANTFIGGPN